MGEWMNLIQMTAVSTTVGENPQKKWNSPYNQQESEVQYLEFSTSKPQNKSQFISKANHTALQ